MPVRVSNSSGTWATILATSPVMALAPAVRPSPVETTVILSTLASAWANARATSGMPLSSLSSTAAWLYSW